MEKSSETKFSWSREALARVTYSRLLQRSMPYGEEQANIGEGNGFASFRSSTQERLMGDGQVQNIGSLIASERKEAMAVLRKRLVSDRGGELVFAAKLRGG